MTPDESVIAGVTPRMIAGTRVRCKKAIRYELDDEIPRVILNGEKGVVVSSSKDEWYGECPNVQFVGRDHLVWVRLEEIEVIPLTRFDMLEV